MEAPMNAAVSLGIMVSAVFVGPQAATRPLLPSGG